MLEGGASRTSVKLLDWVKSLWSRVENIILSAHKRTFLQEKKKCGEIMIYGGRPEFPLTSINSLNFGPRRMLSIINQSLENRRWVNNLNCVVFRCSDVVLMRETDALAEN